MDNQTSTFQVTTPVRGTAEFTSITLTTTTESEGATTVTLTTGEVTTDMVNNNELSTEVIIGIAVGGVALVVLMVVIGFLVARSQRNKKKGSPVSEANWAVGMTDRSTPPSYINVGVIDEFYSNDDTEKVKKVGKGNPSDMSAKAPTKAPENGYVNEEYKDQPKPSSAVYSEIPVNKSTTITPRTPLKDIDNTSHPLTERPYEKQGHGKAKVKAKVKAEVKAKDSPVEETGDQYLEQKGYYNQPSRIQPGQTYDYVNALPSSERTDTKSQQKPADPNPATRDPSYVNNEDIHVPPSQLSLPGEDPLYDNNPQPVTLEDGDTRTSEGERKYLSLFPHDAALERPPVKVPGFNTM